MPLDPRRRECNQALRSGRWPSSKRLKKLMRKRPSEVRRRSCEGSQLLRNGCINDEVEVSKEGSDTLPVCGESRTSVLAPKAGLGQQGEAPSPFRLGASAREQRIRQGWTGSCP